MARVSWPAFAILFLSADGCDLLMPSFKTQSPRLFIVPTLGQCAIILVG
jgi:hypothetical protein